MSNENNSKLVEKIRQQFDSGPYPRVPLEKSHKEDRCFLYFHNLVTPYYLRNQRVIETEGKVILDAGCGSGYKALGLAEANPGAKIVGIDISEESIKLARQRLEYHQVENVEFHVLTIEELPSLGLEFDYINNDEVLYLLPDPVVGLQAMKSVLKPEGIIRTNFHSTFQRAKFFRAQKMYNMMGLMDDNPQEMVIEMLREFMHSLKDQVLLKQQTWHSHFEKDDEAILANHLLQGDKGVTIPEMFSALRTADLEFIRMVNWGQWELMSLFKNPDDLPVFLAISLPETSIEERLHLFELLHPTHRLLDFWCGHPNQGKPVVPVEEWTNDDWSSAKVHLHPQLRTPAMKEDVERCIRQLQPFEISRQLPITGQSNLVDSTVAACLFPPLLESAQSMQSLVERWQQLRPVNPVTLEPTTPEEAFYILKEALSGLEPLGYVLVERNP